MKNTLPSGTRCWLCKRTEEDIKNEIDKELLEAIQKGNEERVTTKEGTISLEDMEPGFSHTLCGVCKGLIAAQAIKISIDAENELAGSLEERGFATYDSIIDALKQADENR